MSVSLNGFLEHIATLKTLGKLKKGMPVKLSDNLTVGECDEGDVFAGVVVGSNETFAAVQLTGYIKLCYSGETAPTIGYNLLSADGEGKVCVNSQSGRALLVAEVDTTDKTIGLIL